MTKQVLTIQVAEFNKVGVGSAIVPLVPAPLPESPRPGLLTTAATRLIWTSNGGFRKISVESRSASTSCIVRINLENVKGEPAGRVQGIELQDKSTLDLLHGLSKSAGSATVRYSIFRPEGEGSEAHYHSIVYTIAGD